MSYRDISEIRVLLAEDHTIVRQGLRSLLESQPDIEVVGEAQNGREAVEKVRDLQPDVVVMDLGMPEMNGVDAIVAILQDLPDTRILVLSMHAGEEFVRPAIRAGAKGYLLKGADLSDLVKAVHTLVEGHSFFSPAIASLLLQDTLQPPTQHQDIRLTAREREILQLIAEGYTSPQIAQQLQISTRTVDTHRNNMMQKLNIHGVAGLVKYAIRIGLTSTDS